MRRLLFVLLFAWVPVFACVDGTTPDCSKPEFGCGPDLDATIGEGGTSDVTSDAPDDVESDVRVNDSAADAADAADAAHEGGDGSADASDAKDG